MTHIKRSIPLAMLVAALMAGPALVKADASYSGQAVSNPAAEQVNTQQVALFIEAFTEVQHLQQRFSEQLENVTSQEEAQALQQQTQQKMVDAVEETGLSVADYNNIVAAMEQDPALRDRILEQVQ